MEIIKLRDEYIKLGQALKAANLVEDGVEAKLVIQDGLVKVNNEVDIRRGRKLYDGDVVSFDGQELRIEIMLRGRQMCSRLFIFAEPQNLTGEVRIKR